MNRYIAAGVLADMREGRSILVVAETPRLARAALAVAARWVLPGERVRRANGNEEILGQDNQGRVLFSSIGSHRHRGLTVDIVVFDDVHPSPALLASVAPNQAAVREAEVIEP